MGGKRIRAARVPRQLGFARPRSVSDRHRLGAEDYVAENVVLRRTQRIAAGEMRSPPIASEGVVPGRNLSGLVLRVRGDHGDWTG
jgi:hypothetical protein